MTPEIVSYYIFPVGLTMNFKCYKYFESIEDLKRYRKITVVKALGFDKIDCVYYTYLFPPSFPALLNEYDPWRTHHKTPYGESFVYVMTVCWITKENIDVAIKNYNKSKKWVHELHNFKEIVGAK